LVKKILHRHRAGFDQYVARIAVREEVESFNVLGEAARA
jgi:hypothetical protein